MIKPSDNFNVCIPSGKEERRELRIMFGIIICLFGLTLLMPNVTAAEDIILAKIGTTTNVVFDCVIAGAPCGSNATCSVFLRDLDGNYLITDQSATNGGEGNFNYSVDGSMILTAGDYPFKANCNDGVLAGTNSGFLRVTPTGDERGISWFLILFFGAIIVLALSLITKNAYFGTIAGIFVTIAGVYTMIFGFNNLTNIYTQILGLIGIGLGFYVMFASVGELLSEYGDGGGITDND